MRYERSGKSNRRAIGIIYLALRHRSRNWQCVIGADIAAADTGNYVETDGAVRAALLGRGFENRRTPIGAAFAAKMPENPHG